MPSLQAAFLHNRLEKPSLFDGGLFEEQLARLTGQVKHVDGLIGRDWCGLPNVLGLAMETLLFAAQGASLFIEKLLRDAPVEVIYQDRYRRRAVDSGNRAGVEALRGMS